MTSTEWAWGYCDDCEAYTGGPFHTEKVIDETYPHPWWNYAQNVQYTDAICFWCKRQLFGKVKTPIGDFQCLTLEELLVDAPAG